jgi:uncharacterized protein (DUF3084 family)
MELKTQQLENNVDKIHKLQRTIDQKNEELEQKNKELEEQKEQLQQKSEEVLQKDQQLQDKESTVSMPTVKAYYISPVAIYFSVVMR